MLLKTFIIRNNAVRLLGWTAAFMAISIPCGCGRNKPVWEVTQPISGEITLRGKPIVDAELNFFPLDEDFPIAVRPKAKSTEEGKLSVWTYVKGDGLPVGSYKVTVIHNEVATSNGTIVAKPNDLPVKYSRFDSTDIVVHVVPGQTELPAIDLK